ncbi:hypothetical protein J4526_04620 [Desulfurococcaceae archaeon MEX13E-LK6-19]|nr:hypothetical protein J4526_04620 [Desulfurococcaceae archaeon MEX13E-LK6-19]
MTRVDDVVAKIKKVFSKYIDEDLDVYMGNRYLLAAIETLIHEYRAGLYTGDELKEIAMRLRDTLIEGPGNVNPFVMEILGILEEDVNEENVKEALEIARRLWREDKFDKLEV